MEKGVTGFIVHNGDDLWDFEILPGCDFKNVNHIHPLKQRDVTSFLNVVREDQHIIGVIIFGSAVRFDCNSQSDLDILVIRDDGKMQIAGSLDGIKSELDIIFASKLGKRLEEQISQTGVEVYGRREIYV